MTEEYNQKAPKPKPNPSLLATKPCSISTSPLELDRHFPSMGRETINFEFVCFWLGDWFVPNTWMSLSTCGLSFAVTTYEGLPQLCSGAACLSRTHHDFACHEIAFSFHGFVIVVLDLAYMCTTPQAGTGGRRNIVRLAGGGGGGSSNPVGGASGRWRFTFRNTYCSIAPVQSAKRGLLRSIAFGSPFGVRWLPLRVSHANLRCLPWSLVVCPGREER